MTQVVHKVNKQLAASVRTFCAWHTMTPADVRYADNGNMAALIGGNISSNVVYVVRTDDSGFWATTREDVLPPQIRKKARKLKSELQVK